MRKILAAAVLVLLAAVLLQCGGSSGGNEGTYQVSMQPVQSDWPVVREVSGQWEVVGEGLFQNTGTAAVTISSVELAVSDADGAVLTTARYGPDAFGRMIMIVLRSPNGSYTHLSSSTSELGSGDLGFCHVAALAGGSTVPAHADITVTFTNGRSETTGVHLSAFDPGQQTIWPTDTSSGDWVAVNTAEAYHHWKGISILNGVIGNSERFALDIMRVDANYRLSDPENSSDKTSYYSWGENILSAGTGTVVFVKNDLPDQEIGSYDANAPAGNSVVIQYGPSLFCLYGHMMNSSATVSVGDAVTAGQVIGRIGNSGYSTAPHLHFQYMSDQDILKAKGLPALVWNAKIRRLADADLLNVVGQLPDIRQRGYLLTGGTYTVGGGTLLEYDIVTAP